MGESQSNAVDLAPRLAEAFVAFCRQADHTYERLQQLLILRSEGQWDAAKCELHPVVARGERHLTFAVASGVGNRFYILVARGDCFLLPWPIDAHRFYAMDLFESIDCTGELGVTPSNITRIVPARLHEFASGQWRAAEDSKGTVSNASAAVWKPVMPELGGMPSGPQVAPPVREMAPFPFPRKRKPPKTASFAEMQGPAGGGAGRAPRPTPVISVRALVIGILAVFVCLVGGTFLYEQTRPRSGTVVQLAFQGQHTIDFCSIAPGRFLMGSPPQNNMADEDEFPQTEVVITRPCYLSRFEITQQDWEAITGQPFAQHCLARGVATKGLQFGPRFPATCVSFAEAEDFCRLMGTKAVGFGSRGRFRLPTEAEWEYACRAGTETAFCFGPAPDSSQMNVACGTNNACALKAVDGLATNGWGLAGMHGNAAEWVRGGDFSYSGRKEIDPFHPPRDGSPVRLHRGGCYLMSPERARSAARNVQFGTNRVPYIGFRVLFEPRDS